MVEGEGPVIHSELMLECLCHVAQSIFFPTVFGGTVLKLGTERHHKMLLKGIDTLDDVGCFGLTELGYGKPLDTPFFFRPLLSFCLPALFPSRRAMYSLCIYTPRLCLVSQFLFVEFSPEYP